MPSIYGRVTRKPRRKRWVVHAVSVLALGCCACAARFLWDGRDSTELTAEQAISVTMDTEASVEHRRSAMGRLFRIAQQAEGELTRLCESDRELGAEADDLLKRLR